MSWSDLRELLQIFYANYAVHRVVIFQAATKGFGESSGDAVVNGLVDLMKTNTSGGCL